MMYMAFKAEHNITYNVYMYMHVPFCIPPLAPQTAKRNRVASTPRYLGRRTPHHAKTRGNIDRGQDSPYV